MQQISMIDANDFVETVTLDDTVYKLHFAYNDTYKGWAVDIRDSSNIDLVKLIRVIPNFPLLSQYKRHLNLRGELIATATNGLQNIGRQDFINGKASIVYVSEAELNAILETTI